MANILALEAASQSCSVTLRTAAVTEHVLINEARSHSQHFLPCIRSLLAQQSLKLADIDLIACGNGPGSFTGLRICFAMAQGLAYGLGLPLLTVPSLVSMAHYYRQHSHAPQQRVISVLDARMGEVYIGEFDVSAEKVEPLSNLQLVGINQVESLLKAILEAPEAEYALVGPGVGLLQLPENTAKPYAVDQLVQPHSSAVADIALQQWREGSAPSAGDAEICYLRNSVTWDKRKRLRS